MHKVQQSAF